MSPNGLVHPTPLSAAWPARTWSPGEKVTAGMMNGVRDQLNELHSLISGGIGSTFAYTDRANIFTTEPQTIKCVAPRLGLIDMAAAVDSKRFDFLVTGNILYIQSLADAGAFQANLFTFNRDGTFGAANSLYSGWDVFAPSRVICGPIGSANAAAIRYDGPDVLAAVSGDNARYASVSASHFYSIGVSNSLGDLTVRGGTNFQYGVYVTAANAAGFGLRINAGGASITGTTVTNALVVNVSGISCTGNITCAGNIHNTAGYLYPGDATAGGGYQGTWFLSSHSTYGLYSNTGLYLAGGLTVVNIVASSVIDTAYGFRCRPGIGGVAGNVFLLNYYGPVQCWIDATYMGDIAFASDARTKRNFTPISGSLDKIRKLRPGSFYYLPVGSGGTGGVDGYLRYGMTAQDMAPIIPELVHNTGMVTPLTPDGIFRIDYMGMIPMLVNAIQELAERLDAKEH